MKLNSVVIEFFSVVTGVARLVSRHSLFSVATGPGWLGDVTTECSLSALRTFCARDRTVLSRGTLHCAVQLFELQCSCTIHEHCA